MSVTLGLLTGLVVHTTAVVFGAAIVFQKSEVAFTALKFVGATYLLYLAYNAWRAPSAALEQSDESRQPYGRMYLRGIVMNLTNPKVAVFFLAFLPAFVTPGASNVTAQLAMLGVLFILSSLAVFSIISVTAGVISQRLRRSDRAQVLMNRIAGVVFIGLAAKLATSHR
jgi:threonine/homoserine/homoserine lactone efflux protein